MKEHKIALLIGRFQPLHRGHIYLIREGLKLADLLIIAIGSANVIDKDNPFTVSERDLLLKEMLVKEKLAHKILKIIEIDDQENDDAWLEEVLQKTASNAAGAVSNAGAGFDVVIGNNDWTNGIFKKAGYPVHEVPYYKRNIYEGKKIREKLRKEKKLAPRYYSEEE